MSRSIISRSLEPLVAILWVLLLAWTAWTAVVWVIPIGPHWLGLSALPDAPAPPNADLRRAVLLFAEHADLAWLALAAVNLHLIITAAHGLPTARAWFGTAAGGALLIGLVNHLTGFPFGWMSHYGALGSRLAGVSVGWLLLWVTLLLGAREAVLRLRPRASHTAVATAAAALVFVTYANLATAAARHRAWWAWHDGDPRNPAAMPAWAWAGWFLCPFFLIIFMREKNIVTASARRSPQPLIILALLNALGLAVHLRALAGG